MAERSTVPNLEAKATDGNPVSTPKQWLERFRQFCKREHKIEIAPLLKVKKLRKPIGPEKNKPYKKISYGVWDRKHSIR